MNKEELKKEIEKTVNHLAELIDQYTDNGLEAEAEPNPIKFKKTKVDQGNSREIQGRINFVTDKAIQVSYQDKLVWIPKSTLLAEVDETNTTEPQLIVMAGWIYKKNWGGA